MKFLIPMVFFSLVVAISWDLKVLVPAAIGFFVSAVLMFWVSS